MKTISDADFAAFADGVRAARLLRLRGPSTPPPPNSALVRPAPALTPTGSN